MAASYKALIVEDEKVLLEAIARKLRSEGHECILATSGREAFRKLNEMGSVPDAIWLDYFLGDMEGKAFMKQLRDNPAWSKIPVFAASDTVAAEKAKEMAVLGLKLYPVNAEYKPGEIGKLIKAAIGEMAA